MTASRADSPCVDLCIYDYDRDFCTGCGRTLDEVSYWNYFTPQEKQQILKESKKNLDSLSGSCYNYSTQGGSDGPERYQEYD
jgi:predicted Fe-S protein YdhL (DUF1289 family)